MLRALEFFHYPFNSSLVGSGEVSKFLNIFYKREDACKRLNFLRDFEFRLHDAEGQTAAWSAAASVMRGYAGCQHAAAAIVDLEELARAGAATEEGNFLHNSDGSGDTGMHDLNYLHDTPNSDGLETDAATDLHENFLDGVFSVHAFGGHGVAASVLGDTASVAFSCTDSLMHGSLANSSFHPIHACAHSCFDGCQEGSGVCDGGCARAPVSFLSSVPDVPDDEDDACMDGNNSVIQGFGWIVVADPALGSFGRWCLRCVQHALRKYLLHFFVIEPNVCKTIVGVHTLTFANRS